MEPSTSYVHVLNTTTFEPFIESAGVVLLAAVILPFSQRSQLLVPNFQKIAASLQNLGVKFAQINAIDTGSLLAPFEITKWPQLMLFNGLEEHRVYQGAFREDEIVAYLHNFLDFPVLTAITTESVAEFIDHDGISVVGYFAPGDHENMATIEGLAQTTYPNYIFGVTSDENLARSEGIAVPSIAIYSKSGEKSAVIGFVDNVKHMSRLVGRAAMPLIVDLAFETHQSFLDLEKPFGYIFIDASESRADLLARITPVAQKYRADIQLSIADSIDLADIAEDLHLQLDRSLTFALREPIANFRYPMNEARGDFIISMAEFIEEYLHGKLAPSIKSEPIPKEGIDALVKVVGLNYQVIVMDERKDVLVIFCITPCGPCERLQPTISTLAEVYSANPRLRDKVTIAKVMYDENDTAERDLRSFPTIKLFPASAKRSPVTFEGNSTFDDLADFIKNEGTHGADLRYAEQDAAIARKGPTESVEDGACSYDSGACVISSGSDFAHAQLEGEGMGVQPIAMPERHEL